MKYFALLCMMFLSACENSDVPRLFEQYLWQERVLIIFAPAADNDLLRQQYDITEKNADGIKERDIITWFLVDSERVVVDGKSRPHLPTLPFYNHYKVNPAEFTVILIGKDGYEKTRVNEQVLESKTLFNLIDEMPMRKQEMKPQ